MGNVDLRLGLIMVVGTIAGAEAGAQMPLRLCIVLHVVKLIWRRLPDLDQGVAHRFPVLRSDRSFDDKRWAILLAQQDRFATRELTLGNRRLEEL